MANFPKIQNLFFKNDHKFFTQIPFQKTILEQRGGPRMTVASARATKFRAADADLVRTQIIENYQTYIFNVF